jgi:hypothetical protein
MVTRFGDELFQVSPGTRTRRTEYSAQLDDDFELRIRGGSGASALSLDFGLGWRQQRTFGDEEHEVVTYKELWRSGIDTEHHADQMGVRIVRTGSGVKPGHVDKQEAFDEFRDRHGIMPQRMLAIINLYAARELEPDYVVALSTEGAKEFSTLGHSTGTCDYTGIGTNSGLLETSDPYWLGVGEYMQHGFYDTLERAKITQREAATLDLAIQAVNAATPIKQDLPLNFQMCTNNDPAVVERELAVYLRNTKV